MLGFSLSTAFVLVTLASPTLTANIPYRNATVLDRRAADAPHFTVPVDSPCQVNSDCRPGSWCPNASPKVCKIIWAAIEPVYGMDCGINGYSDWKLNGANYAECLFKRQSIYNSLLGRLDVTNQMGQFLESADKPLLPAVAQPSCNAIGATSPQVPNARALMCSGTGADTCCLYMKSQLAPPLASIYAYGFASFLSHSLVDCVGADNKIDAVGNNVQLFSKPDAVANVQGVDTTDAAHPVAIGSLCWAAKDRCARCWG